MPEPEEFNISAKHDSVGSHGQTDQGRRAGTGLGFGPSTENMFGFPKYRTQVASTN